MSISPTPQQQSSTVVTVQQPPPSSSASSSTRTTTPLLDETQLDKSLKRLETFLRCLGFYQNTTLSFVLSWLVFFIVSIGLPVAVIEVFYCSSDCEKYEIKSFELEILVSQVIVAAISLFCVSRNLRKYGIRKFLSPNPGHYILFVDRSHGHMSQFRSDYVHKIDSFFRLLVIWVIPCFFIKSAREVIRLIYVYHDSWWESVAILFASLLSWIYSTIIYLSASVLFNLVCNLQVIHFENYGKLLERDLDVSVYIDEHIRLTHHLSKISHRFRIFLLLQFLVVTASQFVALLETTGNRGIINFINGGDFAVSSIVQLVGMVICLNAAAKISHRAQGIASVASKWHAIVTCNSVESTRLVSPNNGGNLEDANNTDTLPISYSESDLDTVEYVPVPANSQLTSNMFSYHKREAFILYLHANRGGATIYGWTVDRVLINTIFFVEMSLVLFVLGKTITFSTK